MYCWSKPKQPERQDYIVFVQLMLGKGVVMIEGRVTCIYLITYHNLHSFLYNLNLSFAAPSTIDTNTRKNRFSLVEHRDMISNIWEITFEN